MSITLLEYFKIILQKVSFNARLFEKELKKAIGQLLKAEIIDLKKWCYEIFGKKFRRILKSAFSSFTFRKLSTVKVVNV